MGRISSCVLILSLWLACAAPASAFGGLLFGSRSSYSSYSNYSSYYYPAYSAGYHQSYYPVVSYSYYVPTYSYLVPVYAAPQPLLVAAAVPCPQPKPVPAVPTFAQPKPAPASQTTEPPLSAPGKPKVKESSSFYGSVATTSYYDASTSGGQNGKKTTATSKVGFWNLTNNTVTIQVQGQVHVLPANRSVTLVLPRQFAWQLEQQAPQTEVIPADRVNYEIVLR